MSTDLDIALSSTQESLEGIGVDDALVREILSYRLLIERLGETDNNGWWESIVLTDTGRARLDEVTQKTSAKARTNLAQRVGRKAEQDHLGTNTVSLFYLGPLVESKISSEFEDASRLPNLDKLENLSKSINDVNWTNELIDIHDLEYRENNETIRLENEKLDESQLKSRTTMRRVAKECFAGYGRSTKDALRVPYYEIEL